MGAFSVSAVILVALLGGLYQAFLNPLIKAGGILRKVESLNNKDCQIVEGLEGCEKIVLFPDTGTLYLACSRISARLYWLPSVTHLNASGKPTDDYVATYDVATGKTTHLDIVGFKNAARGLSNHGMDVVPSASNPSEYFVYLVNHRAPLTGKAEEVGADSVIEIFSTKAGSSTLKHIRTVEDPVIDTPNDVVGSPDGKSFWFTNEHGVKVGASRKFELYLGLSRSSIRYCHVDQGCKIATDKLPGANGIARGHNDTFYVGSAQGAGVRVLEKQTDNSLVITDIISTDGIPLDNLSVDQNGALWAAAFPRGFDLLQRFRDMKTLAASRAIRITQNAGHSAFFGEKYTVDKVLEDDGAIVNGVTTVTHWPEKGLVFLHGISAPHLAVCKVPSV